MFEILRKSIGTGMVTTLYPRSGAEVSSQARGRPEIDFKNWKDARSAANVCPTGAIACGDLAGQRTATLDLGKCIFCGLCAETDSAIRMTNQCELSVSSRAALRSEAHYQLRPDGTHDRLL